MSNTRCPNYISCLNMNCDLRHYHNFNTNQRNIVHSLINELKDEIFLHVETENTFSTPCYFDLLCYHNNTDCCRSHSGVSLTGRKILIKRIKNEEKKWKK